MSISLPRVTCLPAPGPVDVVGEVVDEVQHQIALGVCELGETALGGEEVESSLH